MIKKLLWVGFATFLFIACGGDNRHAAPSSLHFDVESTKVCTQAGKNRFVYDVFKDSYYWADEVTDDINLSAYDDENSLIDAIKNSKDRFSFVLDLKDYESVFESGENKGFGFLARMVPEGDKYIFNVMFVYPGSPAFNAGVIRSDKVLSDELVADNNGTATRTFHLENSAGVKRDVNITEAAYAINNIANVSILDVDQKKVGYFVFQSFVGGYTLTQLDNLFRKFKTAQISDLILDLRYNGGGELNVAAHLGTLIGGENVQKHIFQNHRFNPKYAQYDFSTYFESDISQSLNLKRVFIITTQESASASESLINALRASDNHMEVITIGEHTFGKPYGMYTLSYCDKVLFPIHISNENSDGVGHYVDGLAPTCQARDNITVNFADLREDSLAEALYYIEHHRCSKGSE